MSVYCIVNARQKLHDTTRKIFLNEPLMYNNSLAHCFRLTLTADNGTDPADLTGVTATANFLRPDRGTVAITDTITITGNVIDVILPAACYSSVGRYKLTVDIGEGTGSSAATRTALIVEGITERNTTDTPVDPGTIMPSINDLITEIDDAVNSIPVDYTALLDSLAQTFSATTNYKAGDYVWHGDLADGGKLYRFTEDHAAGAWTGTDVAEAVVTDGVEGDVRYDAAQTLTDGQMSQARANIDALGNGLYGAMNGVIDYGAKPELQTRTSYGVDYTVMGNRLTANGTSTGNPLRVRLYADIATDVGSIDAANNIAGGPTLKAGRTYRVYCRLVSGTYTKSGNTNWTVNAFMPNTNTLLGTTVVRNADLNILEITPTEDVAACVWFAAVNGDTYTNCVFYLWLVDETATGGLVPKEYTELVDTVDNLVGNEAEDFSTSAYYPQYSVVRKDGKLYLRTASSVGHGEWVAADWSETTMTYAMTAKEDRLYSALDSVASDIPAEIADKAVRYDAAQTLTDAQKKQAQANAGAAGEADFEAVTGYVPTGAGGSATRKGMTIAMDGTRVTVSGTATASSAVKYSSVTEMDAYSTDQMAAWGTAAALPVVQGQLYRLRVRSVSGTISGTGSINVYGPGGWMARSSGPSLSTNPVIDFVAATNYVEILGYIGNNATTGADPYVFEMTLTAITAEGTEIPVSGTTPSITAIPGAAYNCTASYVETLSFTPSATGVCSVRFHSGTTRTALNLPQTVRMPDGWEGIEANTTYKITIEDGVWAEVTAWHDDASTD